MEECSHRPQFLSTCEGDVVDIAIVIDDVDVNDDEIDINVDVDVDVQIVKPLSLFPTLAA